MKVQTTLDRTMMAVALTGVLALGACGIDPPPANGGSTTAAPASPAVEGLKLRLDPSLQAATANSATVKCNIETLGGQTLEGVNPKLAAGKAVGIAGWYAGAGGSVAVAATNAGASNPPAGGPGTDPSADASVAQAPSASAIDAPAPDTGDRGVQLLIANEAGDKHWVVALPARTERPDVAAALADPGAVNSGFAVELDLTALAPGFYSLHLSDMAHREASVCGLGRGFILE